jgi:phosphoserine phosphatase RsbU/P
MIALEQWYELMVEILDASHLWQADQLAAHVDRAAGRLGVSITIYLVDPDQRLLRPLPQDGHAAHEPLPIDSSAGGRAYTTVESVAVRSPSGDVWWSPMVNGTDRQGVVAFTLPAGLPAGTPGVQRQCEIVSGLVGHLITTTVPRGDHLDRVRRSRPMTAAAELLWQVLPPLTVSIDDLVVGAILEPAYEVGGDGYDYTLDGHRPQFVILDAAGRGLRAGLACAVAVSAVRAARRAGDDLLQQVRAADAALREQFTDARFVTAVLAQLDLDTGTLRYYNAGHPPPLITRGGHIVGRLTGGRRLPLGIEDAATAYGEETLQPGDRLLLYTDGITEARDPAGDRFGDVRLAEFTERYAVEDLPVQEALRRLSHAVREHQGGPPADDATLMLVEWSPSRSRRTVPATARPTDSGTDDA